MLAIFGLTAQRKGKRHASFSRGCLALPLLLISVLCLDTSLHVNTQTSLRQNGKYLWPTLLAKYGSIQEHLNCLCVSLHTAIFSSYKVFISFWISYSLLCICRSILHIPFGQNSVCRLLLLTSEGPLTCLCL